LSGDRHWLHSCKSNYHTITTSPVCHTCIATCVNDAFKQKSPWAKNYLP
jgi:hypothetical protein